jgi:hypothetical protein
MRIRLSRTHILLSILCSVTALSAGAQNGLDPGTPDVHSPVVTYEQEWKVADPQWYQVSISSTGEGNYRSQPLAKADEAPSEPYNIHFIASAGTRDQIFQLAKSLNEFRGNFETRAKVAQTGKKTLIFKEGQKESKTTLNYSDNQEMNRLVSIFQRISMTFELAQKLDFDVRFDKLGLDRDLKSLEHLEADHQLAELQVISPTLERIANDNGIMNIARQRARRLLEKSRSPNQQHQ